MGNSVVKPSRSLLGTIHINSIENQIVILNSENIDSDKLTMSPTEYFTNQSQRFSSNNTGVYTRRNQKRRHGIIVAKTSQIDDEMEIQDEY
ncbi:unnamed protein product (macronuclear) [Paramecium tetraurelia]|uniref:Uncharacterized protein n=1 Tax=Paramecium tetraurelia TaxID=5888 RepID=A0BM96_PARTE|nr:uncharacterized protein GSPATT00030299001 [Paramecium tetraurelia]CAK59663.1 unnamed protein product [Paramecium tetraurelia]|eukprot:XP_001427061.1 hypothetical protein (macronuclear) [Paramecium tetraurelia strain d4-2]